MAAEEGVIELATLGRPVQLGMLYDCRTDSLIPGLTLWDQAVLQKDRDERPQPGTQFDIISSDRIDDKASSLKVGASLKASVLVGLVEVQGSAKFLNDKKSSNRQARLTVQCKTTSRFEQLTMRHLGKDNIQYPEVFEKGTATHVVTGISYGAEAYFVFDRDCTSEENIQEVKGHLNGIVKRVASFDMDGSVLLESERESVDKIRCKFHGDFNLDNNPSNYEEAVSVCKKLPSMLGSKGENAVPMRVWLYPLHKLDHKAAKLVRQINVNLISQFQGMIEGLEDLQVKCNDIIPHEICSHFPLFSTNFEKMKQKLLKIKLSCQQKLARALPAIRGGAAEEQSLADVLRDFEQSAFSLQRLAGWIASREEEMSVLQGYMELFAGIRVIKGRAGLNKVIHSSTECVICLSFPLTDQSSYLESNDKEMLPHGVEWFEDVSQSSKNWLLAKNLAELYRTSKEDDNTRATFAILGFLDSEMQNEGVTVFSYAQGDQTKTNFTPPGVPGKPSAASKSHDEVYIEWEEPECDMSEVQHYRVKCRETCCSAWQETSASPASSVTKQRTLQFFKCFVFLVTANYLMHTHTCSFERNSIILGSLQAFVSFAPAAASLLSCLQADSSLRNIIGCFQLLVSLVTAYYLQDAGRNSGLIVLQYLLSFVLMVTFVIVSLEVFCTSSGERKQSTVRNLKPLTSYEFQVAAVCRAGVSQVSEKSDACTTLPASPPTQVRKHGVSDSTITLTWNPPTLLGEGVAIESYEIKYRQNIPLIAKTWVNPFGMLTETGTTRNESCLYTIEDIDADKEYIIWVSAVCVKDGSVIGPRTASETVELALDSVPTLDSYVSEIKRMSEESTAKGKPAVFRIPLTRDPIGDSGVISYSFSKRSGIIKQHKVIMVVGAKEGGKSTLINWIINFILRVQWKDDFRFEIVHEQGEISPTSQAHGQTQKVASYTIFGSNHHAIPYTLTVIDTPGFFAASKDSEVIVSQINDLFSHSEIHQVDHIDAIVFVAKSSENYIRPSHKHAFNSILSIFGSDRVSISPNILLLVTFYDHRREHQPRVIDAIEWEGILYNKSDVFKFNLSVLSDSCATSGTVSDDQARYFNEGLWNFGMDNMNKVFETLGELSPIKPMSLQDQDAVKTPSSSCILQ